MAGGVIVEKQQSVFLIVMLSVSATTTPEAKVALILKTKSSSISLRYGMLTII